MPTCPYNPNQPAETYFGLDPEIERVIQGVLLTVPIPFLVVGGRRIGKTSFLWEIERRLERDQKVLAVYIDLGNLPRNPEPAHLFQLIANKIKLKVSKEAIEAGSVPNFSAGMNGFEHLIDFLNRIADKYPERKVVLLLDELELLKQTEWLAAVLRNFRSAINDRDTGGHIALVATTSRENLEMEIADMGVTVMAFRILPLRTLSQVEFHELIQKPIENPANRLSESVENGIWEETGGHPFLAQWIMYQLWQIHSGDLNKSRDADITSVIRQFHSESIHFGFLFSPYFTTLEREIYRLLIESTNGLEKQAIHNELIVPDAQIDLSLKVLEQSGVVRKVDDRYMWNGRMFRDWFVTQVRYLGRPAR